MASRRSLALACSLALAGCSRFTVRPAPFRVRPDSVLPGNLRGPFDGKVTDAATGEPVAGALVYATWSLESGYGVAQPAGYRDYVTSTDVNGGYVIPAFDDGQIRREHRSASARGKRLIGFHLVVYKRGFVAYRSDRRFHDLGLRRDFAQHNNQVELDRWRDTFSHARHLRYLGGGAAIATLTRWELAEAAAELRGDGQVAPARIATKLVPRHWEASLVAAQLISHAEIQDITGYDGSFETGPLADQPDTTTYSSQHFKALGRPESYDLAVRLWQLETGEARQRYAALMETLPNVDERNEIANRSLRAQERGTLGIAVLDAQRGIVILVTCGHALCASPDKAVSLTQAMYDKIRARRPLASSKGKT